MVIEGTEINSFYRAEVDAMRFSGQILRNLDLNIEMFIAVVQGWESDSWPCRHFR